MQQAGLMRTQWDGNCQTTAAGPTVAMGNLTATKCNAWEQLAGDAGLGRCACPSVVPAAKQTHLARLSAGRPKQVTAPAERGNRSAA